MRGRRIPEAAKRRFIIVLNLLIIFLGLVVASLAQQPSRSSLSGSVVDQHSAAIGGVSVTLQETQDDRRLTATTDETGRFVFENVQPGAYRLTASGAGFTPSEREINLSSGEPQSVELILSPGSLAESVVVMASHLAATPEALAHIPGSVEALDPRTLERSRAFTSSEVLRKFSGVNVRDEEGFGLRPNIGIRGLNPTRSTKVLLLEDGIPFTYAPYGDNASYYHPPIDRFEGVEILKGSGQILHGPQTVGGVINYLTRTPPGKSSGFVTLTGGNRSYFNGHANYGFTWGHTGFLFDYTRKQGEGARDNVRSGLNDFNFKSVTTLSSKQALTTKFNYYGEDSNVAYTGLREDEYRADPRQNAFRNDFFYGDRFGASATHAYVFTPDAVLTTNFYGQYFKRHWWRQSSNSTQRPNRLNVDPDCRSMADLNTTCGNEGRLRKYYFLGVEPRLRVNHSLFGVRSETDFGFRAHFETQDRVQKNGELPDSRDGVVAENNERRNQAYSGFVQNRFLFGDFTITPGLRVEHVEYQRTNRLANSGRGVSGASDLTQLIPGLGVAYNPSGRLTLFAGVHRGFAPPRTEDVINNTTGGTVELDPELSWNYEVGFRSAPHRAVRLEATFFRMDYENQIVPASLAGGIGTTLTNGGETVHQGLELTGRLDTNSLADSRHNFYLRGAYTFLPVAEFRGRRFSNIGGFSNVSIEGNRLPYAPEHLLNASIGYAHPAGLDAFIEANYVGSQFADDLNFVDVPPVVLAGLRQSGQLGFIPSYTVWNATANYDVEQLNTVFFVTVKNLFDRTYIADRARGLLPGTPRLVQTGLKFRF